MQKLFCCTLLICCFESLSQAINKHIMTFCIPMTRRPIFYNLFRSELYAIVVWTLKKCKKQLIHCKLTINCFEHYHVMVGVDISFLTYLSCYIHIYVIYWEGWKGLLISPSSFHMFRHVLNNKTWIWNDHFPIWALFWCGRGMKIKRIGDLILRLEMMSWPKDIHTPPTIIIEIYEGEQEKSHKESSQRISGLAQELLQKVQNSSNFS